jgi:hypothetical protein
MAWYVPSKNKNCSCCKPKGCETVCCSAAAPTELSVAIPASEFTNGRCSTCDGVNDTFILTRDTPGGVTCETCTALTDERCCWSYQSTEVVCTDSAGGTQNFRVVATLHESATGECRMDVLILIGEGGVVDRYEYRSTAETSPFNCNTKTWTCDPFTTCHTSSPRNCAVGTGSLTVQAA